MEQYDLYLDQCLDDYQLEVDELTEEEELEIGEEQFDALGW